MTWSGYLEKVSIKRPVYCACWTKLSNRDIIVNFIWKMILQRDRKQSHMEANIRLKIHWFQIFKNCDHENMKIGKLSIFYQISPSEDSKNNFLLVIMSFMSSWKNVSLRTLNFFLSRKFSFLWCSKIRHVTK